MFNSKTIFKYVAIQLAQLVVIVGALLIVRSLVRVPAWVIVVVPGVWILKDIVLYPWLWRAYAYPDGDPLAGLVGMEATAMETLDPEGFVRVHGELWKARLAPAEVAGLESEAAGEHGRLQRGARAKVVGVRGSTLLVEPAHPPV